MGYVDAKQKVVVRKKIPNTKFISNFFVGAKQKISGTGFGGEWIHAKPIVVVDNYKPNKLIHNLMWIK